MREKINTPFGMRCHTAHTTLKISRGRYSGLRRKWSISSKHAAAPRIHAGVELGKPPDRTEEPIGKNSPEEGN